MLKQKVYQKFAKAFLVDDLSVSYTLKTDDITVADKPQGTPYVSRKGAFDERGYNAETQTSLNITEENGGYFIEIKTKSENLSEFGLNIPLRFMGKKNCGGWKNQYLLNSPYNTADNKHIFCYFTRPQGKNLLVLALSRADGWKADYSLFSGGQYFDNFKFLASFDRAYKQSDNKRLKLFVKEIEDYKEAIKVVSEAKNLPVAYYEKSFVKLGEQLKISVEGDFDYLSVGRKRYPNLGGYAVVTGDKYGLRAIAPYKNGKKGLECVAYVYDDINEVMKRSMFSVSEEDNAKTDGNLCEWKCYISAILRYMSQNGRNKQLVKKIMPGLKLITERDESKALPRQTIFYKPQNGFPAYNVYASGRVQEQFFGVGILLDAYKFFGGKKYLDYAVRSLDCVLLHHLKTDGRIGAFLEWSVKEEDYTTVCCLIIPVLDMAEYLKDVLPQKSEYYYLCAKKMAEHVYERGFTFPTETDTQNFAEPFVEEGSMSCSALTLLYYCHKTGRNEKYIARAKEILDLHESWVMRAHIAPMFHSTLRWWETKWEGDKDGNALCAGHAWTIWRAEADYLYYKLAGDEEHLLKARNGFMSNFSKIDKKGRSYTCYQPDYITGGGFTASGKDVDFRIVNGFPKQTDSGLSRYVWSRAICGILKEKGVF